MTIETPRSAADAKLSARWLIVAIMSVLLVWGCYLARGAFLLQGNLLQGGLVLGCVLAFVTFWGLMLLSQKRSSATAASETSVRSRYSKASIAGFVCGLTAVLLALPVDLSSWLGIAALNLSQPGMALLISAGVLGLSILLSVIGLSRPQTLVGKNLGLCALPFAVAWLVLAIRLVNRGN